MKTVTCGRCGYEDEMRRVGNDGADVLPGAWSMVSVTVKPVVTITLCPTCTKTVVSTIKHPELDRFGARRWRRVHGMSEPSGIFGEDNHVGLHRIEQKLDAIAGMFQRFANATVDELRGLNHRQGEIMAAIDDLKAAVAGEDAAIDAIVAYLQSIAGQLGTPDADVEAVVADINAHVAELQAATPAAPVTPTDPTAPVGGGDGTDAPVTS